MECVIGHGQIHFSENTTIENIPEYGSPYRVDGCMTNRGFYEDGNQFERHLDV